MLNIQLVATRAITRGVYVKIVPTCSPFYQMGLVVEPQGRLRDSEGGMSFYSTLAAPCEEQVVLVSLHFAGQKPF